MGRAPNAPPLTLRLLAALLAAFVTLAGSSLAGAEERIPIVTSTTDLRSLVEAVGGERVAVTSLVPPTLDPEEYQPKPQDLARVKDAKLVIRVGLDFDLWFDRLLTQASLMQPEARALRRGQVGYVDASFAVAVLEVRGTSVGQGDGHAHGSGNPHYWLDPNNAEIITSNILEGLARVDPQHIGEYEANRITFLTRLQGKLPEWEDKAAKLRNTAMVAYHNSWAYFARRFRLNIVSFIEQKPGVPPSPAHLAGLLKTMQQKDVRLILRQPHEPERNAAFLSQRTGAKIVVLAPSVGALPMASDYFSLFDVNIEKLLAGLPSQ